MADNTAKIAELRSLLQSGVVSQSVDGQSATFDHKTIRKEISRLEAEDDATTANLRRPHMSSVNMGGFN